MKGGDIEVHIHQQQIHIHIVGCPPFDQHIVIGLSLKIDIRVGRVTRAEPFAEARRPALKLWIDFGEEIGERKSSAQITEHYAPEALVGRQVLAVVNFPKKQIGPFMSECLTLGVPGPEGEVVLIAPDLPVPPGGRLY